MWQWPSHHCAELRFGRQIITDSPPNKKELARTPGNVRHANRCDNAIRCSRIHFPNVDDLLLGFHLFPALGELKKHTTKFRKK
jgi:hypothetical protein